MKRVSTTLIVILCAGCAQSETLTQAPVQTQIFDLDQYTACLKRQFPLYPHIEDYHTLAVAAQGRCWRALQIYASDASSGDSATGHEILDDHMFNPSLEESVARNYLQSMGDATHNQ